MYCRKKSYDFFGWYKKKLAKNLGSWHLYMAVLYNCNWTFWPFLHHPIAVIAPFLSHVLLLKQAFSWGACRSVMTLFPHRLLQQQELGPWNSVGFFLIPAMPKPKTTCTCITSTTALPRALGQSGWGCFTGTRSTTFSGSHSTKHTSNTHQKRSKKYGCLE